MDATVTLNQAIMAAKAGRKAEARRLLESVLNADERNEQAWLWLSGLVDDDEERIICLENVLIINPHNAAARQGLATFQAAPGASQPSALPLDDSPPAHGPQAPAPPALPVADNRAFIVITVVLVLLLICTVVSILAIVILPR